MSCASSVVGKREQENTLKTAGRTGGSPTPNVRSHSGLPRFGRGHWHTNQVLSEAGGPRLPSLGNGRTDGGVLGV